MTGNELVQAAELETLEIVHYPDPRLRQHCVELDVIDDAVRGLVQKMTSLMCAGGGVGLAGPQVGVAVRLFIAAPTGDPNVQVYINPKILSAEDPQDGEEGCLSFPAIYCRVKRPGKVTIEATGLDGKRFQQTGQGLAARVIQHECDHLEGQLLVDRMGSVARLTHRKALKQLEAEFAEASG